MTCERVTLPGGGTAIVCGSRRPRDRCSCGRIATLACDWKVREPRSARKSGTCDKPICTECTTSPAPGKDLCPEHRKAYVEWSARRAGATR